MKIEIIGYITEINKEPSGDYRLKFNISSIYVLDKDLKKEYLKKSKGVEIDLKYDYYINNDETLFENTNNEKKQNEIKECMTQIERCQPGDNIRCTAFVVGFTMDHSQKSHTNISYIIIKDKQKLKFYIHHPLWLYPQSSHFERLDDSKESLRFRSKNLYRNQNIEELKKITNNEHIISKYKDKWYMMKRSTLLLNLFLVPLRIRLRDYCSNF